MPQKENERMDEEAVEVEGQEGQNGDAPPMAMTISMAADSDRKTLKKLRRKPARAPSVASSPMASVSMRSSSGFRLKRAFIVGRRGGPSTPVPSWKVYDSPMPDAMEIIEQQQQHHHRHHHHPSQRVHISARKLAASLWELQELPFSRGGPNKIQENEQQQQQQETQHINNNASPTNKGLVLHGQFLSPASSRVSKGSQRRASMQTKFREGGKKQQSHARLMDRHRVHQTVPITDAPKAEIDADGRASATPRNLVLGIKSISSNLGCGPTTTSEFLKVLNHVWNLEEQHASSMSLVGALRVELDQARSQLQELLLNEKAHRKEVDNISKRIVEERASWREQQEENVRVAVQSIRQELEVERKSKQKLQVLHKKVARDLRDVKRSLSKALPDLERERKARVLMEDVCDELAREIGEDKARVEQLKRESVKVREEVEEERKMLQMAEVWREERVQMKLMEAKLELEEKNAALDKLRSELETFLKAKRAGDSKDVGNFVSGDARQDLRRRSLDAIVGRNLADSFHPNPNEHRVLVPGRNSVDSVRDCPVKQSALRGGPDEDGSEDDDDLHSIELNNESFVRPGSSQWGQHSFQQREIEYKGRRSTDQRGSIGDKSKQLLAGRSQGLERLRKNQIDSEGRGEIGAERDAHWNHSQNSQWIERSIEGGEMREWSREQQWVMKEGREESIKSWQSDHEDSQGLISFSPKVMGRNVQGYPESITRAAGGSSGPLYEETAKSGGTSDWRHRISGNTNLFANPVSGPMHQRSNMISSPTRQWNHYFSSPDPRSKVSSETSRGLRDNSLKAKLLEAKLEGQQAQLKSGKDF